VKSAPNGTKPSVGCFWDSIASERRLVFQAASASARLHSVALIVTFPLELCCLSYEDIGDADLLRFGFAFCVRAECE
jgi:hypothetical protein